MEGRLAGYDQYGREVTSELVISKQQSEELGPHFMQTIAGIIVEEKTGVRVQGSNNCNSGAVVSLRLATTSASTVAAREKRTYNMRTAFACLY